MSVTATPYAHILVHKDLFQLDPKYVYLIPEGESYQSYAKLRQHPEIFYFLNEEDIAELEIAKDETGYSQLISLPTSLKDALIKYFINHKRYYYDVKKKPFQSQMIINIDRKIAVHFATKRMLSEFLHQFEMSYDLRRATIDRLYPDASDEVKKQYISYAMDVINSDDYELRPVNCANSEEKNREIEELVFSKQCNVIIGSLTLARGISFPTLLSFYYINEKPKKYTMDNIIQVCRFLGYREKEIPFFSL
ncbi:MAG: hypothetical protein MJ201_01435 [Mycoplasmoidaceae bacterium]|nr:hypothetical protein [Mycoplasmoidaceae bacterium]